MSPSFRSLTLVFALASGCAKDPTAPAEPTPPGPTPSDSDPASDVAAENAPDPAPTATTELVPPSREDELARLVEWMTGAFSSAEQASRDSEYLDIRLFMARIWPERTDGAWIYVEQATATALARPYRQRVYRVTASADGLFRSDVFELLGDPLAFAGAWRDAARFRSLEPDSLRAREGCAITLFRAGGDFSGATQGNGCASALRGATYATSSVRITSLGMATWDRGFDSTGTQVWGATKGPYEFTRVDPEIAATSGAK